MVRVVRAGCPFGFLKSTVLPRSFIETFEGEVVVVDIFLRCIFIINNQKINIYFLISIGASGHALTFDIFAQKLSFQTTKFSISIKIENFDGKPLCFDKTIHKTTVTFFISEHADQTIFLIIWL